MGPGRCHWVSILKFKLAKLLDGRLEGQGLPELISRAPSDHLTRNRIAVSECPEGAGALSPPNAVRGCNMSCSPRRMLTVGIKPLSITYLNLVG